MGVTNFDRWTWPNRGWNLTTLIFKCSKANIRSRIGNIFENLKPVIIENNNSKYLFCSLYSYNIVDIISIKSHNIWSIPIFSDLKFLRIYFERILCSYIFIRCYRKSCLSLRMLKLAMKNTEISSPFRSPRAVISVRGSLFENHFSALPFLVMLDVVFSLLWSDWINLYIHVSNSSLFVC